MSDHDVEIPSAFSFAWDTVEVLRDLGGSASIEEMNEAVVKLRGLTEEQQAVPHSRGNRSEIEYRLAWARTLDKELGLSPAGACPVGSYKSEPVLASPAFQAHRNSGPTRLAFTPTLSAAPAP